MLYRQIDPKSKVDVVGEYEPLGIGGLLLFA